MRSVSWQVTANDDATVTHEVSAAQSKAPVGFEADPESLFRGNDRDVMRRNFDLWLHRLCTGVVSPTSCEMSERNRAAMRASLTKEVI